MAKHISIEEVVTTKVVCDHCGGPIVQGRRPHVKCVICNKDLCKNCKRHVHVEIGSGNGKPVDFQTNDTKNYCPTCLVGVASVVLSAFGDISHDKRSPKS